MYELLPSAGRGARLSSQAQGRTAYFSSVSHRVDFFFSYFFSVVFMMFFFCLSATEDCSKGKISKLVYCGLGTRWFSGKAQWRKPQNGRDCWRCAELGADEQRWRYPVAGTLSSPEPLNKGVNGCGWRGGTLNGLPDESRIIFQANDTERTVWKVTKKFDHSQGRGHSAKIARVVEIPSLLVVPLGIPGSKRWRPGLRGYVVPDDYILVVKHKNSRWGTGSDWGFHIWGFQESRPAAHPPRCSCHAWSTRAKWQPAVRTLALSTVAKAN